jgi:hypothetical protein
MKFVKLLSFFLILIASSGTAYGQYILRTDQGDLILNKEQEVKILSLLQEKEILYLEIQDKDLQITYLKNKEMDSFRLTQALMEGNEKLQGKVLTLSKKVDEQAIEIGKLQKTIEIKTNRLRAFQVATAVTSVIIILKFLVM